MATRASDWLLSEFYRMGLDPSEASPRFRQSLEIATTGKQIYVQQPHVYYFPGLPQIQFFERDDFDWVSELESKTDVIRRELEGVLSAPPAFEPHVPLQNAAAGDGHQTMAGNRSWSSFYLWNNGRRVEANALRCPETVAAMNKVPLPYFSSTSPSAPAVMFSMLRAGARIPPHTGSTNVRLICHLPLIVPPGCGFRVGNEVREWEVGKLIIFDDTIEHEVWNRGQEDRIVLIFDIWRPELSAGERQAVTTLFKHRELTTKTRG